MPKKLEPSANSSMKLLGLFSLLLFSGRRFSLTELASRIKCSKQTILRLIDQLSVSCINIQMERKGRENWYWAESNQRPLNVSLKPEAIQKLLICKEAICHLLPESFRDEVSAAIQQTTVLLEDFGQRETALSTHVSGLPKGKIDYDAFQDILKTLMDAIRHNQVCKCIYHAPKHKQPKEYQFIPQLLTVYRDALYIRGYSYPEEEEKTFAVHRFKSVATTSMKKKLRQQQPSLQDKPFGFMMGRPFALKVEFDCVVAAYVRERTWSADQTITQKKNGNVVLGLSATSEREVLAWILSFGKYAKIISPKSLKDYMKSEIEEMDRHYAQS